MKKKGFTAAWQIKDLSARHFVPRCRRNGGWERFRLCGFAYRKPAIASHTCGRLAFAKCKALSSSFAFTLAEVLITLAIIGVVASLTIPTVVRNYQKHQTVTRLKKAYSSIIQATNLAVAQYGATEGWEIFDYRDLENGGTQKFGENYLVPYLKLKRDCQTSTIGECAVNIYDTAGNRLNFDATWSRLLLTEGILIAYATYGTSQKYANFFIDVNGGIKKPNILGKDVFHYVYYFDGYGLKNGKFLPANYSSNRTDLKNNCKVSTWTSNTCAALIQYDGWQIKDDYPL